MKETLGGPTFEMDEAREAARVRLNPPVQAPLPLAVATATRIRRATTRDLAACVRMSVDFWQSSPYAALVPLNLAEVETLVAELLDHGAAYVAAREDGELVGMIGAGLSKNRISGELTASEAAWWVDPEHRGSAVARELLEAAEAWAVAHGAVRFELTAPAGDARVRLFYRRRGYVEIESVFQRELTATV